MDVHARQFLIGPSPLQRPGWLTDEVTNGIWLSRDSRLPLDGDRLGVLLGDDPDLAAGRFVRLDGDRVELDACGTLGVFHRRIDGQVWLSSSLALLRRISPELPPPDVLLEWNGALENVPPPLAAVEGISALLASQTIDVRTGDLGRRSLLHGPHLGYDATVSEMDQLLRQAVTAAAARGPVWLPLTAGSDSRLLLAACVAERVPVVTYTMRSSRIDDFDLHLPPKIADAAGVEHRLIEPRDYDADVAAAFAEHTDGLTVDMDSEFVPRGQWEQIPTDATVLGGNVWEVGRCYYHDHRPDAPPEWHDWPTEEGIDWRDRLYLEQRIGGWLAAFEQGVDFTGRTRVHVANNRRLVTLMLGVDEERRRDGVHQRDVLKRLAPQLTRFPVNRPSSLRERARLRVDRERELVRYHGSLTKYTRARLGRITGSR